MDDLSINGIIVAGLVIGIYIGLKIFVKHLVEQSKEHDESVPKASLAEIH